MKVINLNNVSYEIIKHLYNGKSSFVIYPYGEKGKLVKKVLNEVYQIKEIAIVDNHLSKDNKDILSVDELLNIKEDFIILLSSDNREIHDELRNALSDELEEKVCDLAAGSEDDSGNDFSYIGAKMNIDTCSDEQIRRIFEETKKAWKKLGEEEPYWSVVTWNEFKSENLDECGIEKFYRIGVTIAFQIVLALLRNGTFCGGGYSGIKDLDILEIGCGCGRVTKSLAALFKKVIAVDISNGNLNIATQMVTEDNVDFRLIEEIEDYGKLPQVDVVYSTQVLQHNCPPVIEYLIDTMFHLLKDNGIAIFQVPTYKSDYCFEYDRYIDKEHGMEMHVLPQQTIFKLAYKNNCIPLEVYPYAVTGSNDNSMMFIFRKNNLLYNNKIIDNV